MTNKPEPVIVKLKPINLTARAVSSPQAPQPGLDSAIRAALGVPILQRTPENIFTPEELVSLEAQSSLELFLLFTDAIWRIKAICQNDSIINLTPEERSRGESALKYQMRIILGLVRSRTDPVSLATALDMEARLNRANISF